MKFNLVDETNLENPNTNNLRNLFQPNRDNQDLNIEKVEKPLEQEINNLSPEALQLEQEKKVPNEVMESVNNRMFGIYCLTHLTILVLSILITVFVFILKFTYAEISFYQDTHKNWSKNLFFSISNSGCQKFQDYLIQEEWPGTIQGCACSTSVRQGYCGKRSKCSGVGALSPVPIELWRGTRFCRKSDSFWQNKSYFDLDIKAKASECKVGSRSCGIIDSIGNHLCVENKQACPVNSVQFYDKDYFEINIKKTLTSEDQLLEAYEGVLVFSSKEINTLKIPVDFKTSIGQPCSNPYFKNIVANYTLEFYSGRNVCYKYTNSRNETETNSKTSYVSNELSYDNNFQQIDKINMADLYKENGIANITYALPLFPKNEYDRDLNLYSRNYFGLKLSCYNNIKEKKMVPGLMEELKSLFTIEDINTLALQIFTLLKIIFVVMLVFGGIILKEKNGKTKRPIEIDRGVFCFYFVIGCITMAFTFAVFIASVILLTNFKSISTFDSVFNNSECVDDYSLQLYQNFITDLSFVKKLGLANAIMSIVSFSLMFLYTSICLHKTRKSLYE